MFKFFTKFFCKVDKPVKPEFEEKLKLLTPKERWQFIYLVWSKVFDIFDFEDLRETVLLLSKIHDQVLTDVEIEDVHRLIDNARFENYLSLNNMGNVAHLLTLNSEIDLNDSIDCLGMLFQIGEYNFTSDSQEFIG